MECLKSIESTASRQSICFDIILAYHHRGATPLMFSILDGFDVYVVYVSELTYPLNIPL